MWNPGLHPLQVGISLSRLRLSLPVLEELSIWESGSDGWWSGRWAQSSGPSVSSFIFKKLFFKLEYNCLTMLCQFLQYDIMNQLSCSYLVIQFYLTLCDCLEPTRLLCPWGFSGNNPRVGCHFLLHGVFPTQASNLHLLGLLHCRQILYCWAIREAPESAICIYLSPPSWASLPPPLPSHSCKSSQSTELSSLWVCSFCTKWQLSLCLSLSSTSWSVLDTG